ncbi:tiny macrocysts protein b-related [Anaeramoeba flamelloides]|uniref:Tiny macrocysts protein b-related n=1 Tax=Anaeramoeba flamelloides TaxID=1746091 RepID=A0ABQ8Z8E3_9EUKA|nr:tiny macrocysts protein b-related [Anaeramoeba flamelloides]
MTEKIESQTEKEIEEIIESEEEIAEKKNDNEQEKEKEKEQEKEQEQEQEQEKEKEKDNKRKDEKDPNKWEKRLQDLKKESVEMDRQFYAENKELIAKYKKWKKQRQSGIKTSTKLDCLVYLIFTIIIYVIWVHYYKFPIKFKL